MGYSSKCSCPINFTGLLCEQSIKINENAKFNNNIPSKLFKGLCLTNPCQNKGFCIVNNNSTQTCVCPIEYSGKNCEILTCLAMYVFVF